MKQTNSTAAIILAAGSSSRMGGGRHKLLLPLDDRPVLAHVIAAALASQARPILIVLGHQAEQVRTQIASYTTLPAITLVENRDYLQGMSTSLRVGLEALIGGEQEAGQPQEAWQEAGRPQGSPLHFTGSQGGFPGSALIMLGDQPLVTVQIIDTLIATWRTTGKRIVAPLYAGKRGNPILFAASLFPELMEVIGDEGGRSVIERYRQDVVTVELGDATASYDVDTWEEYQQVVEGWQRKNSNTNRTETQG